MAAGSSNAVDQFPAMAMISLTLIANSFGVGIEGGLLADVQTQIVAGIADARTDVGIAALLIPSIDREAPAQDAQAMVTAMLAARNALVSPLPDRRSARDDAQRRRREQG